MGDDCNDLLREIADFLHGELPADRAAALRSHLDGCPPCFESADFQAQLKAVVASRCIEHVPDEFKQRLVGFLRDSQPS